MSTKSGLLKAGETELECVCCNHHHIFDISAELDAAEAEMRELMECGHPKACEAETPASAVSAHPGFGVRYCTACEEQKAAVAEALREARK